MTKSIEKRTHIQKRHEESGKPVCSPKDTTLGKSGLSILQLSGKSDTSTHQPYPKNNKNSKETALGKSQLFPVQISGKPDTSICRPKKQNTEKLKDTVLGKSELCPIERSGKSDKFSHFPKKQKYKKTNEIGIGKLQKKITKIRSKHLLVDQSCLQYKSLVNQTKVHMNLPNYS